MTDNKPTVDQKLIRELAALLDETGLTEIEIERDKIRVRVARSAAAPAPVAVPWPSGRGDPAHGPAAGPASRD